MRILWVKVGGVWPPDTGGRLRSFHLISELSRRHSVILATTHVPGDDPGTLSARLPACERILSIPALVPKRGSLRFLAALARSWLSPLPVDVAKFRVDALAREVRRLLEAWEVDLCVADFLSATVNLTFEGPVPVLFFAHNVEHVIWKRLSDHERRPWRRALLAIEWRKMRTAEQRACARATLTAAVSEADRERLSALAPGARVCAIPTGVDTSYFAPDRSRESPLGLVFTGSMDWHPNEDAVLHFLKEIMPRVRSEVRGASLTVAGRNPSPRLMAAAARAGARVTGRVDDIRPHIAAAAVYVVPLRIGGGTRLKIFEALAMGKAVVSTTVGAEGLPLVPGTHFLQEDDPERFGRAVITLLNDPELRRSLGDAGRRLVEARASWSLVARDFEARCEEAVELHRARRRLTSAPAGGPEGALRSRLPAALLRDLRAFTTLDPGARSIYWKSRLRRALGAHPGGAGPHPEPVRSVLFLCRGNIIRSPMAEALIKRSLGATGAAAPAVSSAGLHAVPGRPADARARIVARELGVSLDRHRSRTVTAAMVARADLIIAMDSLVEAELLARYPTARSKVRLLSTPLPGGRLRPIEIADPYDGDLPDIRRCYRRLRSALEAGAAAPFPVADGRLRIQVRGGAFHGAC